MRRGRLYINTLAKVCRKKKAQKYSMDIPRMSEDTFDLDERSGSWVSLALLVGV